MTPRVAQLTRLTPHEMEITTLNLPFPFPLVSTKKKENLLVQHLKIKLFQLIILLLKIKNNNFMQSNHLKSLVKPCSGLRTLY